MTTAVRGADRNPSPAWNAAYPPFLARGLGDCAGSAFPDDWTEDGDRPWQKAMRERARSVCQGCPFKMPCRRWAAETDQQGMYGAVSTSERRRRARA